MSADVIDSNIVPLIFTPKREYVWEHRCAEAGQTFFLHRDGSVQCEGCKQFIPELCWGKRNSLEKST